MPLAALAPDDLQLLLLLRQLVLQRRVVLRDHLEVVAVALHRLQLVAQLLVLLLQGPSTRQKRLPSSRYCFTALYPLSITVYSRFWFSSLRYASASPAATTRRVAVLRDQRVVAHLRSDALLQGDDLRFLLVHQVVVVLAQSLPSKRTRTPT